MVKLTNQDAKDVMELLEIAREAAEKARWASSELTPRTNAMMAADYIALVQKRLQQAKEQ